MPVGPLSRWLAPALSQAFFSSQNDRGVRGAGRQAHQERNKCCQPRDLSWLSLSMYPAPPLPPSLFPAGMAVAQRSCPKPGRGQSRGLPKQDKLSVCYYFRTKPLVPNTVSPTSHDPAEPAVNSRSRHLTYDNASLGREGATSGHHLDRQICLTCLGLEVTRTNGALVLLICTLQSSGTAAIFSRKCWPIREDLQIWINHTFLTLVVRFLPVRSPLGSVHDFDPLSLGSRCSVLRDLQISGEVGIGSKTLVHARLGQWMGQS
ncbi:hypothetical protein JZ751_002591 [Albula glossodonta]|uniref:Uncharacterized protein n=1 Tax=Albula glossodonta TaxID=121402 RepID=A0A8T2N8H4_9TELE|nr:hypothetical protein JZ751_002591 [Albula glossodonta]